MALHQIKPEKAAARAKENKEKVDAGEPVVLDEVRKSKGGRKGRGAAREPRPPTAYTIADEIAGVANRMIAKSKYPHLGVLRQARILYVFSSAERVGGEGEAKASRFPKTLTPVGDYDFVITFSRIQWERFSEPEQNALVYHHLLHCGMDDKSRWRIVQHDFEGFVAEVEQFGAWSKKLKRPRQLGLFDGAAEATAVSDETDSERKEDKD